MTAVNSISSLPRRNIESFLRRIIMCKKSKNGYDAFNVNHGIYTPINVELFALTLFLDVKVWM